MSHRFKEGMHALWRSGAVRAYWIGKRMSGIDSCASIELSMNSIREWHIASGWIVTLIFSGGIPNSWWASITSRPLFIIVAESTVIFFPIFHTGCLSTSFFVICFKDRLKNGPPEAVRIKVFTLFVGCLFKH